MKLTEEEEYLQKQPRLGASCPNCWRPLCIIDKKLAALVADGLKLDLPENNCHCPDNLITVEEIFEAHSLPLQKTYTFGGPPIG